MSPTEKETLQKLINITFNLVLTAHIWPDFSSAPREQVAEWVAQRLRDNGFDTEPVGMSWGVLKEVKR